MQLTWIPALAVFTITWWERPATARFRSLLFLECVVIAALYQCSAGLIETVILAAGMTVYSLLFCLDFCYYERIGRPLDPGTVRLILKERESAYLLIKGATHERDWLVFFLVPLFAILAFTPAAPSRVSQAVAVAASSVYVVWLFIDRNGKLSPALNVLRCVSAALLITPPQSRKRVVRRVPFPLSPSSPATCNILMFAVESFSDQILHSSEGREAAPAYHAFLRNHAGEITEFPKAFANSATSDLSYTALLTGLSPGESLARLTSAPLLWAAAKTAGHHTSFYCSQSLRWLDLGALLLDPAIDRAVHRDALGARAANDLAMDDRHLNRIVCHDLKKQPAPFLSVINYNMLHFPFLGDQSERPFHPNSAKERYLSALALFDRCFSDVIQALAAAGSLENTAILVTGDHGEDPSTGERKRGEAVPRLYDLRYEFLKVPCWLKIPGNALSSAQQRALTHNLHRSISNLDLYPTILDLLGYQEAGELALSGHSLLKPLPETRSLVAFNSGELRAWDYEPFSFVRGDDMLLYHDLT
ncbi:MAG: sulfatase-like hydrolase/transferase, partial [Bryobacteraceae bacterium]